MELKLKIGIGELKFGMSQSECIQILGQPNRTILDEDDENELILQFNLYKTRLTFYKNENGKLGYIRTANPDLRFKGKLIINESISVLKNNVFLKECYDFEREDLESFYTHFNEENWLTLHEEYGEVTDIELGVPFKKNNEDYNWPD